MTQPIHEGVRVLRCITPEERAREVHQHDYRWPSYDLTHCENLTSMLGEYCAFCEIGQLWGDPGIVERILICESCGISVPWHFPNYIHTSP